VQLVWRESIVPNLRALPQLLSVNNAPLPPFARLISNSGVWSNEIRRSHSPGLQFQSRATSTRVQVPLPTSILQRPSAMPSYRPVRGLSLIAPFVWLGETPTRRNETAIAIDGR
jgi:hypothetical protein